MKKTLLIALLGMLGMGAANASPQQPVSAKALFKSNGRTLQESSHFRSGPGLERVPSKAQVYGLRSIQGHAEVCPSAPTAPFISLKATSGQGSERTARALLIYTDNEGATNRIIEMPITSGPVESFTTVAGGVPKMPYKNYGEVVVTAVAFDDKFMASTYCDMLYSQTNSVYTVADWKHQYDYDYRVADLEATAITYSSAEGVCYGVFQGINPSTAQDEWFFGRWIDPSSYTQPQPLIWLGTEAKWYGMAAAPDGTIYAIDGECNLLKVDPKNATFSTIGATGLANKYKTSACYDAASNRILFATCLDTGSAMNSIDPTTGRATMLYAMPKGEQIIGLFIPDAEATDKAPAAVTNLKAEFPLGSLTGNITFDVPSTYFDGTTASGSVNYEVRINGDPVTTGTTTYGAQAAAEVTMESSGEKVVTVRLYNDAGYSPFTRETLFCGTPQPRAPSFEKAITYNEADKCFEISWRPNPNTSGQYGGAIINNDLTYELIRYPDQTVITPEAGALSIRDPYTPASDNFEIVYYELCTVYHGVKSFYVRSNPLTFGIITPPFVDEMMNQTSVAAYSYLTTPTDKISWGFIGAVTQQDKQHGWMYHGTANSSTDMDSYLLMAPMKLEKGKIYTLAFTAACTNTSWRNEKMAVYMGRERSVEGVREQTLMAPMLIYERREENGERHTCNFSAPEDGIYYIAFHHNSGPNLRYLYIGDISVSAAVDGQVPAEVENLTVQAAANGQLKATLSFNLPTKSVNGTTLTETTKVRIYRNDELISDATPSGNYYTYTDNNASNGINNYVIVPYNSKGDGLKSTANVFVGVGKPVNPKPFAWYGSNDGQAEITWAPSLTDEFGTQLTDANVRYEIQREAVLSTGATERNLIADNLAGTSYLDQFCQPDADQTSASYWVRAVTDGGNSQWVSTRKLGLGKPYTTPWVESFANGECEYNWHTVGSSMNWALVTDDIYDDVKSVDGDNGFFLAQAAAPETTGLVYSGCISIPADMADPVLSLYYLDQGSYQGTPVKNFIELAILCSNGQVHVKKAVCNGEWGWKRMAYDMSAYKGQKVQVGIYMECIDRPFIGLDAFRLATCLEHDIDMVRISGPEEVAVGQDAVFTVSYENLGKTDIPAGYKVQLYCGDILLDEVDGKAIKVDARQTVNFTVKTNPSLGERPEFHAYVKYNDDSNPDNNISNSYTLKIENNIGYPEPQSLKAERFDGGVKLEWTAPDMSKTPRETYTEDFEQFESFAKEIPGWIILDEDKGIVSPISNAIQTPETWGSAFGFFVQDNSVAPFSNYTEFDTTSGHKYMASQFTADESGNSVQNNDWLISPELSGHRQIASFMGKSISSSWPESFEVLYSSTGTDISDFKTLGGVVGAPSSWIHYTVELPEGARYFAIRCFSFAALQFMVDDVTLSLLSCDRIDLTLQGYNIYRDGRLVNNSPVNALDYNDTAADSNEHSYMVTAVYNQGESTPSEVSMVSAGLVTPAAADVIITVIGHDIVVTVPDGKPVEIFNAAGMSLHKANGSTSATVADGVYLVKAGSRVEKVIVR